MEMDATFIFHESIIRVWVFPFFLLCFLPLIKCPPSLVGIFQERRMDFGSALTADGTEGYQKEALLPHSEVREQLHITLNGLTAL